MSTTTFPGAKDTFTNPTATNPRNSPSLAAGQTLQNDAIAAIETAIGITASTDNTSLTYKVNRLSAFTNALFTETGSANAYVITPSPAITAYAAGQSFEFIPANSNTSTSTLNVNALGSKAIQYQGVALIAGQLSSTAIATVVYDGTQFQLLNPSAGAWNTWSPVWTGFSAAPTAVARYFQMGKMVFAQIDITVDGTSNSNALTVTLPVNAKNVNHFLWTLGTDNGGPLSVPGRLQTAAASNVATAFKDIGGTAWTTSGAKDISFSITYEAA